MVYLYLILTSFFSSILIVPPLRQWAVNSGRLDLPERRKIHKEAIPRIGGVAIFLSFLFSLLVFYEFNHIVRGLIAGSVVVFLVGLLDDLTGLTPKQKFLGQGIAAALAITLSGVYLTDLGNLVGVGNVILPIWLAIPFTVFAIVGVANAINMFDGLDGLAGGTSVLVLGGFLFLAWQDQNYLVVAVAMALIGAILGFLKDNSYPATIFMGDSGSLVLGFVVGFLAVMLTQAETSSVSAIVPVVMLGLPIIDTLTVMVRRVKKGKSPFFPDLTHMHHKFLNLGFHHRFTVIVIYTVTLVWVLLAILFHETVPDYLFFGGYLAFVITLYALLRKMLDQPQKFKFLQSDSDAGVRESNFYIRLLSANKYIVFTLFVLVVGYFLLSATSCSVFNQQYFIQTTVIVLLSGLFMLFARPESRPRMSMTFYVSAIILTVFITEQNCGVISFGNVQLENMINSIFVLVGLSVIYLIAFRRKGEMYLTTPLDFLLLAITVTLAIVSPEIGQNFRLTDVCIKAIVLILAVKILASRSRMMERCVYWGLQIVLITFVLKNII